MGATSLKIARVGMGATSLKIARVEVVTNSLLSCQVAKIVSVNQCCVLALELPHLGQEQVLVLVHLGDIVEEGGLVLPQVGYQFGKLSE